MPWSSHFIRQHPGTDSLHEMARFCIRYLAGPMAFERIAHFDAGDGDVYCSGDAENPKVKKLKAYVLPQIKAFIRVW